MVVEEVSRLRNRLKLNIRARGNWVLARIADLRNLFVYGSRAGPLPAQLLKRHGTWETAMDAIGRTNKRLNKLLEPKKMRLDLLNFNLMWVTVRFDTDSGKGRLRILGRSSERSGWAHKHRRHWHAVWYDAHQLVYQIGRQTWRLAGPSHAEWEQDDDGRHFRVVNNGVRQLEIDYSPPFLARLDPTFDKTDDEASDFFLWLACLWQDPERQAAILAQRSDPKRRSDPGEVIPRSDPSSESTE